MDIKLILPSLIYVYNLPRHA